MHDRKQNLCPASKTVFDLRQNRPPVSEQQKFVSSRDVSLAPKLGYGTFCKSLV